MGSQRVRQDWVTELNWTCVVRSVDSGARLSGSAFWLLLSSYSTLGNLLKPTRSFRASLVSQLVKNPSAMRETWVWSLSWKDPLEESMATHSSILAWRISMDREIWWATVYPVTKSQTRLSYWASTQHTRSFNLSGLQSPRLSYGNNRNTSLTELLCVGACFVAQTVKNLPIILEIRVLSKDQTDPLENGMATHSSILAWRIAQTEELDRLQSMGHKESKWLSDRTSLQGHCED